MDKACDVMVVLTTGKQDRGVRATLAFGWACTALAMGKTASVYLTMDGTYWAVRKSAEKVHVEGFEPLQEYITQFFELGGSLLVCAPCSEYYCGFDRSIISDTMLPGAELTGLSTIVAMASPATCVISF
jgi:uncharacterized protein involved in oxidation of intracellular sulfur